MKRIIIMAIVAVLMAAMIVLQHREINALTGEMAQYRRNTISLMQGIEKYRLKDSLYAVSTGVLELKLEDFERTHSEDLKLIGELKGKNKSLKSFAEIQSKTILHMKGEFRDSIVYRDTGRVDTIRCVNVSDRWFKFTGCEKNRIFEADMQCFDSLVVIERIKYKRFLGFLWKTKKVKERSLDVVSKNPHNSILSVESVVISK